MNITTFHTSRYQNWLITILSTVTVESENNENHLLLILLAPFVRPGATFVASDRSLRRASGKARSL